MIDTININKNLKSRLLKHFGTIESIPKEFEDLIKELNCDYSLNSDPISEPPRVETGDLYQHIIEKADEGICIVQDMSIKFINPKMEIFLGYGRHELLTMNFFDVIEPNDAVRVKEIHRTKNNNDNAPLSYQSILINKSGDKCPVEISVSTIFFNGEAADLLIIRDITQRIESERALHESNEQYRLLAENLHDIIWTMDLNLKMKYISPSCELVLGWTSEEILRMELADVISHESMEKAFILLAEEFKKEETGSAAPDRGASMIIEYRCKDGSTVWAEAGITFLRQNGKPAGIIGVSRDITLRREAEEKLRRSEENLRAILETIEDGYYEVDLTGKYVFLNSSFCRMMGYSPEEIMNMDFKKLVHPESHKDIFMLYHNVYLDETPVKLSSSRYIRKDGEVRHAEGSVALRYNAEGGKIGFCGIIRDVNDRKKMEDSLKESEQRWRLLYNSIPGGSIVIGKNLVIMDANQITCEITGYKYTELVGEKCCIICPKDPSTCSCTIYKESSEKIDNAETIIKTKDGRKVPVIISAHRISTLGGDTMLANFHDISRMKEIEQTLRMRNEEIEKDLKTAQLIQKALINANIPAMDWIQVEHRYLPLDAVGGDYFSFTRLREGGLGIFLGDVSSHGVTAALFLALVKATSERIYREHALNPKDFITMLNAEMVGNMPLSFLTATYGILTTGTGGTKFTFSSAGHPHPIIYRAGSNTAEFVNCKGTLIGIFKDLVFEEKTLELNKGDRLFLYTDGIPETENEKKELIGYMTLTDLITEANGPTLEATLDNIIEMINIFKGKAPLSDDIVLIGFEVK